MGIMSPRQPQPKDPWPEGPEPPETSDEVLTVRRWRYKAARKAGLTIAESELFAASPADVGVLRRLVEKGCAADLIARILL